ncbi:MAG: hypothetical protein WKF57_01670 [Nakamurella sp.]
MSRTINTAVVALILSALVGSPAHAADDDGEINTNTAQHTNSKGQTTSTVSATVYGETPAERKAFADAGGEKRPSRSGGGSEPSNCYYRTSTDRLSLQVYDKSVKDGFVLIRMCGGQLEIEGMGTPQQREIWLEDGSSFVGYEDPAPAIPAPTPPQPQDFLDEAMGELTLPAPDINIGPEAEQAVVNLPLSFWVGGQTEYQATAGLAGGVGVVVTARMKSVTWNFGEPASTSSPTGAPATLTCNGPGAPATATADRRTTPDCGHAFRWKSTADRTGGSGAWTVGASVQWDVTWQSTGVNPVVTGAVGNVAPTQNTAQLQVLEYRDRLVDNPNAAPGG